MPFNLTMDAIPLSLAFEGAFKPKAWLDKVADPPVWTIGTGLTELRQDDGTWRPVRPDDRIDEEENEFQTHHFFREKVEPALARMFDDVSLQPHQRNALASIVYNAGPGAFPKTAALIQLSAPMSEILDEWVDGEWNGALGLYRRRLMEAIVYGFGWPWENAYEATKSANWSTNWRELVGMDVPATDEELFEDPELQIPHRGANEVKPDTSDPTPETPMTMDDSQYVGYVAAVGDEQAIPFADFMAHRTLVTERNAIKAPKVDTKNEPKALEDSETANGFAKEVSGKDDVRLAAIMSGAATTAGLASTTSDNLSKTMENTQTMFAGLSIMQLVWVGLLIGLPLLGYGLWKMHRGKLMKSDGRAKATRAKV